MKILFVSVGTRGDAEPFVALAKICQARGDEVVCALPRQLCGLAEEAGIRAEPLTSKFLALLESRDGRMAMGGKGSAFAKMQALYRLYRASNVVGMLLVDETREIVERELPDRIAHHPKATYPMLWDAKNPGRTVLVSPVPYVAHATKDHPHLGINLNLGGSVNRLTYRLAEFALMKNVKQTAHRAMEMDGISIGEIRNAARIKPTIFCVSPSIVPPPDDYPDNARVLGFHSRGAASAWAPTSELEAFIASHDKILFMTFGSMVNDEPAEKTKMFLDIVARHEIPTIINTSGGGLVEPEAYDRGLAHFVASIPYDWVLPKMYAMIHHGGAGTTHQALRHGCASMVVPHIIDQFLWADIVARHGAGPRGVPIAKLSTKRLAPKIVELMTNASYKARAAELSASMKTEDFTDDVYAMLTGRA